MIPAFFAGWIIGFVIAIPPGPLSLTVFTYAIKRGRQAAVFILAGAIVFEIVYALLGFMGIRIAEVLHMENVLRMITCVVVLGLGIKHTFSELRLDLQPVESKIQDKHSLVFLGLILAGSAPTIAAAYLALAGVVHSMNIFSATFMNNLVAALAAGVGSMSWTLCILFFIHRTRKSLSPSIVRSIARASGILLIIVGIYYVIDLILHVGGEWF
jgi:threonine/homoserine/homoserine lactone efflux protein